MKAKKSVIIIISFIILIFSLIIFAINLKFGDYTSSEQTRIDGLKMTHILKPKKSGEIEIHTKLKYASPIHSFWLQIWRGNGSEKPFYYSAKNKDGEQILKTKSLVVEGKEGIFHPRNNPVPAVIEEKKITLKYYKEGSETIIFETIDTSEKYEGYIEIVVENNFFSKIFIGNIVDGIFYPKREKVEIKKD